MTLYMNPPKLSLSPERNPSSSSVNVSLDTSTPVALVGKQTYSANKGTVLYKTFSPRKKIDKFGLDQTDYKAYCLSTTVFPTAVKTTLLSELHNSNPHSCGFDIIERPTAETTISSPSCATSVINAPPPTAVTSQRSIQSAPIVAFVQVPSAEMTTPSSRHPSAATGVTKSTVGSQVFSDVESGPEEKQYNRNSISKESNDNIVLQNGVNNKEGREAPTFRDGSSAPRSSVSSLHPIGAINGQSIKMNKKKADLLSKASGKKQQQTSATVQSFSKFDESRLIRYRWKSREIKAEEDKKDGGDIRDTMYLNTFCPEERPVRFNKISLPRIGRASRQRPWTVSESKFSARSALALMNKTNHSFSRVDRSQTSLGQQFPTPLRGVLKHGSGSSGGVSKSAGLAKLRQQHAWREQAVIDANSDNVNDNDDDKENDNDDNNNLGNKPLLEIRSFLSTSALGDQREKLKGRNGCLNSRVKQCVRFVRYRERLDRHEDNRPLKSEHGKYRPFSKTDVRDHHPPNPAPTPELKLQQSVETYQHYMETIARQTNLSSPKPNFSFKSGSQPSSSYSKLKPGSKLAGSSLNFDSGDATIIPLALDSSRPDGANGGTARLSADTPRPKNSAIYTKDVSAMGQALDIKRISPVPTVNRVVPGTRGVIQRTNSPRVISASSDNEDEAAAPSDDVITPLSPGQHGDTIVVPMASKSECPSEYSVTKDD